MSFVTDPIELNALQLEFKDKFLLELSGGAGITSSNFDNCTDPPPDTKLTGFFNKVKEIGCDRVKLVNRYIPNEDVAKWFRAADIVVLPYLSATQSGIIPIAYQCNRPVITTRVGGLPDMVEDGKSGYLIEPNNPTAIADAIHNHFEKLNAPDLTDGIQKMAAKLSWSGYADSLESFINQLKES